MAQNPKIEHLGLRRNKKYAVVQATFSPKKDGHYTRQQIKKIVKKYGQGLKDKGLIGELQVSLFYGGQLNWRSGKWFKIGDEPNLYKHIEYDEYTEFEEPDHYKSFIIYVLKKGMKK
jgi:hypothetical protein